MKNKVRREVEMERKEVERNREIEELQKGSVYFQMAEEVGQQRNEREAVLK